MTEIHELSCVCAEVGMLKIKKTRLTSEMLSTPQASEPELREGRDRLKNHEFNSASDSDSDNSLSL